MNQKIQDVIQYKNNTERDIVKQFFSNPSEIDQQRKTIVFSTPFELKNSGGFQK